MRFSVPVNVKRKEKGITMDYCTELYKRYLAGDDSALGKIVEEHNTKMTMFIYSYVKNSQDAEDIAAETFLSLIIKKPHFKEDSSFKTWLYQIARNKALDYLRSQKRHQSEDISEHDYLSNGETPENEFMLNEREAMLHRAMEKMPEDYREVLQMMYFSGMTTEQIATVLKTNNKKVINLTYRAKQSLKKQLEKEGFIYEE